MSSPAGPSTEDRSKPRPFQTDVRRTQGLQTGRISSLSGGPSTPSRNRTAAVGAVDGEDVNSPEVRQRKLVEEEERLNKRIDEHIRTLEGGVGELVQQFKVADKDAARIEQEALMSEYRCDLIVRAVQGLSSLSKALQLSLLLSQSGSSSVKGTASSSASAGSNPEETERQRLIAEIEEFKSRASQITGRVLNIDESAPQLESPPDTPRPEAEAEAQLQPAINASQLLFGNQSQPPTEGAFAPVTEGLFAAAMQQQQQQGAEAITPPTQSNGDGNGNSHGLPFDSFTPQSTALVDGSQVPAPSSSVLEFPGSIPATATTTSSTAPAAAPAPAPAPTSISTSPSTSDPQSHPHSTATDTPANHNHNHNHNQGDAQAPIEIADDDDDDNDDNDGDEDDGMEEVI